MKASSSMLADCEIKKGDSAGSGRAAGEGDGLCDHGDGSGCSNSSKARTVLIDGSLSLGGKPTGVGCSLRSKVASSSEYALVSTTGLRFPNSAETPVLTKSGSCSASRRCKERKTLHRGIDVAVLIKSWVEATVLGSSAKDSICGVADCRVSLGSGPCDWSSLVCCMLDIVLMARMGPSGLVRVVCGERSGKGPAMECLVINGGLRAVEAVAVFIARYGISLSCRLSNSEGMLEPKAESPLSLPLTL